MFVYVFQSESSGRFYIGVAEDPKARLIEHNRGQTVSTRNRGPWVLFWTEEHSDRISALSREREIKAWKSRNRIRQLADMPR
jgi:putative endonuclease